MNIYLMYDPDHCKYLCFGDDAVIAAKGITKHYGVPEDQISVCYSVKLEPEAVIHLLDGVAGPLFRLPEGLKHLGHLGMPS